MAISVIIPTYNEEAFIGDTICALRNRAFGKEELQVLVVDGGSQDQTIAEARKSGAEVVPASQKSRSIQMNEGVKEAKHEILYFLHADTHPPRHFDKHIIESVSQGYDAGCFNLSFDHPHLLLRFYSWCTRFNIDAFRYGDQSLFITQKAFTKIGGFNEGYLYLEDYDLVKRIKSAGSSFVLLSASVTTSARKYLRNGILRLQLIFVIIFVLYKAGVNQSNLHSWYQKLVH